MKLLYLKVSSTPCVTNKKAKGKTGSIVAIIAGTKAEQVIQYLYKIPSTKRNKVKEITLDMANTMKLIVKKCFPKAMQVTDRFHVQKLALDGLNPKSCGRIDI